MPSRSVAAALPVAPPLGAIFLIQAILTMASYGISVIAPDAAADLGLDPDAVGYLASSVYFTGMLSGLASQWVLERLGPTRTFQWLLGAISLGCLSLMAAHPGLAFAGAILIGVGTGPMNPAGSFVLARVTPLPWQPMVFSLKQCATPLGGMLAGALLPPLALLLDWRLAVAVIPAAAAILILAAPGGRMGPAPERAVVSAPALATALTSLRDAFATPALCGVVLMGTILGTCQLAIASYFVVYLWSDAGMTPVEAGQVFVVFHVAGIVARIALGAIAQRFVPTRYILAGLGLLMALATAAAAGFSPSTPTSWIYTVTALIGASGNAWVGLFFAEIARLAPEKAASVAGGAQFTMFIGISVGPLAYGLLLELGASHGNSLVVFAGLAGLTVLMPALGAVLGRRGLG